MPTAHLHSGSWWWNFPHGLPEAWADSFLFSPSGNCWERVYELLLSPTFLEYEIVFKWYLFWGYRSRRVGVQECLCSNPTLILLGKSGKVSSPPSLSLLTNWGEEGAYLAVPCSRSMGSTHYLCLIGYVIVLFQDMCTFPPLISCQRASVSLEWMCVISA